MVKRSRQHDVPYAHSIYVLLEENQIYWESLGAKIIRKFLYCPKYYHLKKWLLPSKFCYPNIYNRDSGIIDSLMKKASTFPYIYQSFQQRKRKSKMKNLEPSHSCTCVTHVKATICVCTNNFKMHIIQKRNCSY